MRYFIIGYNLFDKININKYKMILMDLQMPIINGFELSDQIRKINDIIPIIGYTSISKLDIAKSQNKSINQYISKIDSKELLLKTISKWCLADYKTEKEPIPKNEIEKYLNNTNILIADEESLNRKLISSFLRKRYKANIQEVAGGKEIIDEYKRNPNKYDIIITDINMPKINGIEACRAIRKIAINNNLEDIRIIAISGDSEIKKYTMLLKMVLTIILLKV